MTREYRLVSGDSHVNEPPELWQDRVPEKYQERAPKMVRLEQGDAWIVEGALDPINFGLNQCANIPAEERSAWIKWENVRRGGFDPKTRLEELDVDGVDAELLYPTPRLGNQIFWENQDAEFHLALIRAYNDWLSEYCSHAPGRLHGLAMMPAVGADAAVAEFRRAMKLPGMRGVVIGQYPSGNAGISPEDDPFWAELQDAGVPVSIHVALVTQAQGEHHRIRFTGEFRFMDAPGRAAELIYSQALDRFPGLKVVFAEVDCGWVPYVKEQMEKHFRRGLHRPPAKLEMRPSDYFDRNLFFTFITDAFAIKQRHDIGVDNMLWSSDYPHTSTDWPETRKNLDGYFKDVPPEEMQKILAGNAMRLYRLGNGR